MTEKKAVKLEMELHTYAGIQCVKNHLLIYIQGSSQCKNIHPNSAVFQLNVLFVTACTLVFFRDPGVSWKGGGGGGTLTDAGTPGEESNELQNI